MSILSHRLKHIIRVTLPQFLGMAAIITVGISLYIGFNTTFVNLQHSQEAFYTDNNFADHYFYVVRAPEAIIKQVESVSGVSRVTGRIQKDIPLLKDDGSRATVRLTSYSLPLENELNRIEIMEGKYFEKYPGGGAFEVMVDPGFYAANRIRLGSSLDIVAENRRYPVNVVGTAIGPEFAYPMKDSSSVIIDYKTFGIMMMPYNQVQKVLNLPGQINQVIVRLDPGTGQDEAAAKIKDILAPYGNLADFPRKDQSSHAVLNAELEGISTVAGFMPALFLGIAAAIQFILLRRMIKFQRVEIGILKGLGFDNSRIILHFSTYALIVGIVGAVMGVLLGIGLASVLSRIFAEYFNLPAAIGGINLQVIAASVLLALGISFLAGFTASRSVMHITPAEAMKRSAPISSAHSLLESWAWLWKRFDTSWKMAWRNINRNPLRFIVTMFGVASAVALLAVSVIAWDSIQYMYFTDETNYDYMLRFEKPVKDYELLNISRIDGVEQVEGCFSVPVEIQFNNKTTDDLLQGQDVANPLKLPTAEDGTELMIPGEGVIISQNAAKKLNIQPGDTVTVKTALGAGDAKTAKIRVTGINYQAFGTESYVSLEQINRIMQESSLINHAMLVVDPAKSEKVEKELSDMTGIISIQSRQQERENVQSMMGTMVSTIGTMVFFSALLGFVIIFNSVLLSFNERRRELNSLLTTGFTHKEISQLMFKETIPQAALGILAGLPAGRLLAELYFNSIEFDMWTITIIINTSSYLWAALGGIAFVLIAQCFAGRGIKKLNTVELLKNVD